MLASLMQPVAFRDLSEGQLLSLLIRRRVTQRAVCASSVLLLWHLSPAFDRFLETAAARDLRAYKGFRWILADMFEFVSDWAFTTWCLARTTGLKEVFPSAAHAMIFNNGLLQSFIPLPTAQCPPIDKREYAEHYVPKHSHDYFVLDVSTIMRTRLTSLIGIVGSSLLDENPAPLPPMIATWTLESAARVGCSWVCSKVWPMIGGTYPVSTAIALYLGTAATGVILAQYAGGWMSTAYMASRFGNKSLAEEQRIIDDMDVRNEVARQLEAEHDASAGQFLLAKMEPDQIEALYYAAQAVVGSSYTHHAARIEAIRAYNALALYQDGMQRGEMDRGAADDLEQVSRRLIFKSSEGVEVAKATVAGAAAEASGACRKVTQCAVCVEEYSDGDELIGLVCGHVYHDPCIREWLLKHKECPLCRHDVRARADTETVEAAYDTGAVVRATVARWAWAKFPGDVGLGRWGDAADFARAHLPPGHVPEAMLQNFDSEFEPIGTSFGLSDIGTALVTCFFDLNPCKFEGM